MKEGLFKLLELQQVDLELIALEAARDQYPAEISQRQGEIKQAESLWQQIQAKADDAARQQRLLELDLETAKESLKQHEERFAIVTSNKEYDALQQEVESCKTRISECGTQILQLIDGGEELKQAAEVKKQDFESVQQAQQALIDEVQGKLDTLQEQVDGVEARREGGLSGIDHRLLHTYERSRRRRGLSVAAVRKGACGGCYRQMPAQQRSNVKRNDQIHLCESCGAIMLWDDEST